MNFIDTKRAVKLVLETGEVPLIVGESGIGKTALAKQIAKENNWSLIVIDGNLLKEGEIGGLPTVENYSTIDSAGNKVIKKTTIYAIHHKLREIDKELSNGNTVLLFIDEINRCEHTVQQELMNLILNKEINGYQLYEGVKILAAMNPSSKYGTDYDYQVIDMDAAQENRFVWLEMEADSMQWIGWAIDNDLDSKIIEFISTFPEYLHKINEDSVRATPRSYERISKVYQLYQHQKETVSRLVFLNVLKGNVGKMIAEELILFLESEHLPLLQFEDIFAKDGVSKEMKERIQKESHSRLYLSAKNILRALERYLQRDHSENEFYINRLVSFLNEYPVDLRIGIMKDMKSNYRYVYQYAIDSEEFVSLYYDAYHLVN